MRFYKYSNFNINEMNEFIYSFIFRTKLENVLKASFIITTIRTLNVIG